MTWRTASGPAISMTFCSGRPRHAPDAAGLVAEAKSAAGRNPVATALARRAGALLRGDADGVLGTAAAFAHAGYPYQQARTLALAATPPPGPGSVK